MERNGSRSGRGKKGGGKQGDDLAARCQPGAGEPLPGRGAPYKEHLCRRSPTTFGGAAVRSAALGCVHFRGPRASGTSARGSAGPPAERSQLSLGCRTARRGQRRWNRTRWRPPPAGGAPVQPQQCEARLGAAGRWALPQLPGRRATQAGHRGARRCDAGPRDREGIIWPSQA